jgi:hypothetical protein
MTNPNNVIIEIHMLHLIPEEYDISAIIVTVNIQVAIKKFLSVLPFIIRASNFK